MKRNKKHENRVRKMVVACCLSAIVLTASTYAWFIGMKTVNVSPFEVNIAAIDGLALSLSGNEGTFSDTVTIKADNFDDPSVVGDNSNNAWSKLVPMSTVGKIDSTSSNLIMYEKGSLTASDGGYRLMASRVNNKDLVDGKYKEMRGYVAFDLFIKNLSGNAYYAENNKLNEEAIYLTTESNVSVSDAGADAKKTGIENSVRVAFAQIGRVEVGGGHDDGATLRAIKCTDPGAGVTSICRSDDLNAKTAQIWEPNDTKHVDNAINWYTKSCASRSGADAFGSFGTCKKIEKTGDPLAFPYYKTYAVNNVIDETDKVDVYDGEYNGYLTHPKLTEFDYFTDSEKLQTGVNRPAFMTLAPKSITKVRVYVYLEGQDIDNYDFASLGKKISVAFGFSKERFTAEDIEYSEQNGVKLPSDVKAYEYLDYSKTSGEPLKISNEAITYQDGKFKIPRGVRTFTFNDGNQLHRVTSKVYEDSEYQKEVLGDTSYLNPTYIKYTIE